MKKIGNDVLHALSLVNAFTECCINEQEKVPSLKDIKYAWGMRNVPDETLLELKKEHADTPDFTKDKFGEKFLVSLSFTKAEFGSYSKDISQNESIKASIFAPNIKRVLQHEFIHSMQSKSSAAFNAGFSLDKSLIVLSPKEYIKSILLIESEAYTKYGLTAKELQNSKENEFDYYYNLNEKILNYYINNSIEYYEREISAYRINKCNSLQFVSLGEQDLKDICDTIGPNYYDTYKLHFGFLKDMNAVLKEEHLERIDLLEKKLGIENNNKLPVLNDVLKQHKISKEDFIAVVQKRASKYPRGEQKYGYKARAESKNKQSLKKIIFERYGL